MVKPPRFSKPWRFPRLGGFVKLARRISTRKPHTLTAPNFVSGNVYHVFNHANGFDKLFYEADNYDYFLRKAALHLEPTFEFLAYCLLENHFHFVLRVREESQIDVAIQNWHRSTDQQPFKFPKSVKPEDRHHYFAQRQITNFLGGYTQAINRRLNRRGSMFQQNTKRKWISSVGYLLSVLRYVNLNAVHHGLVVSGEDYPYSSFAEYFGDASHFSIPHQEVMNLFGGEEAFFQAHRSVRKRIFVRDLEPKGTVLVPGISIYEGTKLVGVSS